MSPCSGWSVIRSLSAVWWWQGLMNPDVRLCGTLPWLGFHLSGQTSLFEDCGYTDCSCKIYWRKIQYRETLRLRDKRQNIVFFLCKEATWACSQFQGHLQKQQKKIQKNHSNWIISFFYGGFIQYGFYNVGFFNNHFFKFISMPIKYIAIVLLGQEPSNPNEHPGDSWYSASLLCHIFLELSSINLATTHASVWFIA